ncbi:hypothetical protein LJR235_000353 [Pararhizobium sp. LjRoot235]|uniref:hypothetical protein n=1 Tax=Pararhizobium sp. LjRoot235 TaxID=3342291 RepID=UPI003ECE2143
MAFLVLIVTCFANSTLLLRGSYGVSLASFYGLPAISRTTGKMYALISDDQDEYSLFESTRTFGLIWKKVPGISVGVSYNDYHRGHDVLISPDSRLLFTRHNTTLSHGSHVLLSDVIDISVSPPKVLVQGLMCCGAGGPTEKELEGNHQRVLPIARAADLKLDP